MKTNENKILTYVLALIVILAAAFLIYTLWVDTDTDTDIIDDQEIIDNNTTDEETPDDTLDDNTTPTVPNPEETNT
ncbi:hypothetical protein A2483_05715 [Candidatus Peregrinibacteria bacterium RIFOXYC2_FULL_33_13]|nr:MAG: hypothetical protein UR27_C0007G0044 [Candidatus Peregrinibacteria bacterium GW2011_GWA2_33_10]KKP40895.1 MAG: hypothetical protein UR30_C0003G0067 [Candidatus Peregrinibacteria bacterium GW2011_GWC2_33_13]OGJ47351.1 MAG: hypothetical protein A2229_05190 [Candidatus Peregrinibacteria bacterium RIFOXYA2_FULL_33_7]OGJ55259.1 MAG: hypothetical protein A2483_05715 [Candidatus Peregrinibacteria bacterium RIFOXYC2_FULL_33_13]